MQKCHNTSHTRKSAIHYTQVFAHRTRARKLARTSATHTLSLNALLYIPERNDLKCIIRSHAEVKSGCGLSHANCYTVFSAPFEEKGIMGGLIELRGDTLNLQGNVFKACGQEEAVALLEGNADYEGAAGDGNFNGSKRQVTENLLQ